MYGLLLESFSNFVKLRWGEDSWDAIRRHANLESSSFCIHEIYPETVMPKLTESTVQVLGIEERELSDAVGEYFVDFVSQFGYDQILSLLGRHMRDFLNGLDNLHEYLKFSYPKMIAPSFFCEKETASGMILHYRSKRRGFVCYTMGQIKQVAKRFYDTECSIQILTEEMEGSTLHVIFDLKFDNRAFIRDKAVSQTLLHGEEKLLLFPASKLFELFPFCIVFSHDMVIRQIGYSLSMILKDLMGASVTEAFELIRPIIPVTFASILERQNNTFELVTIALLKNNENNSVVANNSREINLHLRGQMLYMKDWNSIVFLASPVMPDLDTLFASGLYLNDLSLHDCSRDYTLAGTQQSAELQLALHQEQLKTKKLEISMKKLDYEMKRTDELLYQMIPKAVANRLRRGLNFRQTCEVFDAVSILFSDVVSFTEICSRITPMQVVDMLNHMYSLFDQLTERNGVYKVETIGDSYMVVCGAPNQELNHAEKICDMGMDMMDASKGIYDPSREVEHLELRIGIHSGNVVAGVVGLKMPRYCLFGDTVNTSSRMESTSEAGKIQISKVTQSLLPSCYETRYRDEISIKGKGKMKTYWLISRLGRSPLTTQDCTAISWSAPSTSDFSKPESAKEGDIGTDLAPTKEYNETISISPQSPDADSEPSLADNPGELSLHIDAQCVDQAKSFQQPNQAGASGSKGIMKAVKEAITKTVFTSKKKPHRLTSPTRSVEMCPVFPLSDSSFKVPGQSSYIRPDKLRSALKPPNLAASLHLETAKDVQGNCDASHVANLDQLRGEPVMLASIREKNIPAIGLIKDRFNLLQPPSKDSASPKDMHRVAYTSYAKNMPAISPAMEASSVCKDLSNSASSPVQISTNVITKLKEVKDYPIRLERNSEYSKRATTPASAKWENTAIPDKSKVANSQTCTIL